MFRLELPVLVSVAVCVLLLPTVTFPKLKPVGLAESWSVAAMPVPFREMRVGEFVALLTNERLPSTLPPCSGANSTVAVVLWPAASFMGVAIPLRLKPNPEIETWETLKLALPELVSVMGCVFALPIKTLPKLRVLALVESSAWPFPVPGPGPDADELEGALPQLTKPRAPIQAIASARAVRRKRGRTPKALSPLSPGKRLGRLFMFCHPERFSREKDPVAAGAIGWLEGQQADRCIPLAKWAWLKDLIKSLVSDAAAACMLILVPSCFREGEAHLDQWFGMQRPACHLLVWGRCQF